MRDSKDVSSPFIENEHQASAQLEPITRKFIILMVLEMLILVVLEIVNIAQDENSDETDEKYQAILVLLTVATTWIAIDAAIEENKFQMITFVCSTIIFLFYTLFQFFDSDTRGDRTTSLWARFLVSIVFVPLNLVLAYGVWENFGWRAFTIIGADPVMLELYTNYQIFLSLLKLDILFGTVGVLFIALFLFTDYELYVDIGWMIVTLLWAFIGRSIVRREDEKSLKYWALFFPVTPLYIVSKLVIIYILDTNKYDEKDIPAELIIAIASASLITRLILVVSTWKVYIRFGRGLKEYFERTS